MIKCVWSNVYGRFFNLFQSLLLWMSVINFPIKTKVSNLTIINSASLHTIRSPLILLHLAYNPQISDVLSVRTIYKKRLSQAYKLRQWDWQNRDYHKHTNSDNENNFSKQLQVPLCFSTRFCFRWFIKKKLQFQPIKMMNSYFLTLTLYGPVKQHQPSCFCSCSVSFV